MKIMWASSCGLCSIIPQNSSIRLSSIFINRPSSPHSPSISDQINNDGSPIQPTRRKLLTLSIIVSPFLSCTSTWAEVQELERYTDLTEGFTLLTPKSWIKVEKAGATLLFEDPSKRSNNLGVVVTPVRLTSLRQFGDPQFVSNKLLEAEKRKESTKGVEIVSFMERPSQNGDMPVYEFEYNLDSTRGGLKTIFSAAFVASKKLYLLNIAHSQQPPLDYNQRMMLEKVIHSFDVIPPSSTNQ